MLTLMDAITRLLPQHPLVFVHLAGAIGALALGAALLWRRKGTPSHRALGWAWVPAMGTAVVTSAFIRNTSAISLMGFSPIHLLTVFVAVYLPRGVWYARQGRIEDHRKAMHGLYLGGCVVAGLFALIPGRFLGQQLAGPVA